MRKSWWMFPLLLGCASVARAADPEAPDDDASKEWQFSTLAYVWAAGAEGKTDFVEQAQPIDLDLSFGDVIDAFKFAMMGSAEARRDRFVLLGDFTFIHLGAKEGIGIRDPDLLEADLDTRTIEVTALGGYRVVDGDGALIDLLGGARANFLKTTLELTGPNRSAEGDVSETWFDPLVGARAYVPLGGKFGLSLYGDVGGFGIGSDLTWQGAATIDYDINHKFRTQVGWRYFKVDYDKGDFLYNVAQSGPFLGLRTAF